MSTKTCPHCGINIFSHWKYCDSRECLRAKWRDSARKKKERKMKGLEKLTIVNTVCDCPEGFILTPNIKRCPKCGMENIHYHHSFEEIYKSSTEKDFIDIEKVKENVRKRNGLCIKCEDPVLYRNGRCGKCYKDQTKLVSLLKRQRHFMDTTNPAQDGAGEFL